MDQKGEYFLKIAFYLVFWTKGTAYVRAIPKLEIAGEYARHVGSELTSF